MSLDSGFMDAIHIPDLPLVSANPQVFSTLVDMQRTESMHSNLSDFTAPPEPEKQPSSIEAAPMMVRIKSDDGVEKEKYVLPRSHNAGGRRERQRKQHEQQQQKRLSLFRQSIMDSSDLQSRLMQSDAAQHFDRSHQPDDDDLNLDSPQRPHCLQCNMQPKGFRGEHELDRHVRLFHAKKAKKWVCEELKDSLTAKDLAEREKPKLLLKDCQNCRSGKQYGQYYNAAAHLRRYHFNPKARGRPKAHERRAGIAGGRNPPIEVLKKYWMREIEVVNDHYTEEKQPGEESSGDVDAASDEAQYDPTIRFSPEFLETMNTFQGFHGV